MGVKIRAGCSDAAHWEQPSKKSKLTYVAVELTVGNVRRLT